MSTIGASSRPVSLASVADDDLPTVPPHVIEAKPSPPHMPLDEVLIIEHEKHMPEGVGILPEERRLWPWVAGGLATAGLLIGAVVIGATVNWLAAAVGIIWLLMGYAVAWIVVWGAGLMRSQDEVEAEHKVERGELPPPAERIG
ncbi:MAG: hypothetical protein KF699_13305 [Phycisphaeraceae bacterium]|nr:hypothetical protein [Phycisphaeraceae bacterium]